MSEIGLNNSRFKTLFREGEAPAEPLSSDAAARLRLPSGSTQRNPVKQRRSPVPVRETLAKQQQAFLNALVGDAPSPPGFDAGQLHTAALALAAKRCRSAKGAWPMLARSLGARFDDLFSAYAASTYIPVLGGALADGDRFARALPRNVDLSDAARTERLCVKLRYKRVESGLVKRKGPVVRITVLRESSRFVLGCYIPRIGKRFFSIRFRVHG